MIQIPKLNITCGTSDCDNGHHAFNSPLRKYKQRGHGRNFLESGVCKKCGVAPVDWAHVHARDPSDITNTFEQLRLEFIRWEFWTRPFNERSLLHAKQTGRKKIFADVTPTIDRILRKVPTGHWDNMQVPVAQEKMSSVIQYAQHAVAACCRKCAETWHGLPQNRTLTNQEIEYLSMLVCKYLDERLPASVGEEPVSE